MLGRRDKDKLKEMSKAAKGSASSIYRRAPKDSDVELYDEDYNALKELNDRKAHESEQEAHQLVMQVLKSKFGDVDKLTFPERAQALGLMVKLEKVSRYDIGKMLSMTRIRIEKEVKLNPETAPFKSLSHFINDFQAIIGLDESSLRSYERAYNLFSEAVFEKLGIGRINSITKYADEKRFVSFVEKQADELGDVPYEEFVQKCETQYHKIIAPKREKQKVEKQEARALPIFATSPLAPVQKPEPAPSPAPAGPKKITSPEPDEEELTVVSKKIARLEVKEAEITETTVLLKNTDRIIRFESIEHARAFDSLNPKIMDLIKKMIYKELHGEVKALPRG